MSDTPQSTSSRIPYNLLIQPKTHLHQSQHPNKN